MILPTITSTGPRRHGEKIFHGAALAFARDRQGGDHDHRHGEHDAEQAGHDVVLGDDFGVVERVDAQVDRTVGAGRENRAGPSDRFAGRCQQAVQRAEGVAGGAGIGRIRLHENGGPVAAEEVCAEILREC